MAYTLLTPGDARFAGQLLQALAAGGAPVAPALHELALKVGARPRWCVVCTRFRFPVVSASWAVD